MTSDFYFFDQFSRASHIRDVCRTKRDSKDLNQALHQVKLALSIMDENIEQSETSMSISIKKQTNQPIGEAPSVQITPRKLKIPIIPEILIEELDRTMQIFDNKSDMNSLISSTFKFHRSSTICGEQDIDHKNEFINRRKAVSDISLPKSLVIQLNSTWSDLIRTAKYEYKVWHTKAAKEAWHQYLQRKYSQSINVEMHLKTTDNKSMLRRQTSSCVSRSTLASLSHRESLRRSSKINFNQSLSCTSLSASNISQDNQRLLKAIHQESSDHVMKTLKTGIHVEFKLSTQTDETIEKSNLDKQNIVLFDIRKLDDNDLDEMIALTQDKCKRLLAETKQKIIATTSNQFMKHLKNCRIWFYEDNRNIRNKNHIVNVKDFNRRPKSKFVLAILRNEIPEKYNINIDISETKHKCYIELTDGSSQIYYPSGRLAVLCLPSSSSTTIFFNDTKSIENQFLGLVTHAGNVLLMQPKLHARFITNNQHEFAYLCDVKTGIIEKQIRWNSADNDDINSALFGDTVQLQLNSFMQLEYQNSSNIRFSFRCQNEKFHYQLGVPLSSQTSTSLDLGLIFSLEKNSEEKTHSTKTKKMDSIISNSASTICKKKPMHSQQLCDGKFNFDQMPMKQELITLRKRIKHICHNWLKLYRIILGITDTKTDLLSDSQAESSSERISTETQQAIDNVNHSKSVNQLENIRILPKQTVINKKLFNQLTHNRVYK
ncbi:unnamed protein product [Rotaria socialis]|uniref:FAM194 C-terminal domain-containing protein n=1 Tax=Rotaria socialis TaxID=392032 RepID=A0A820LHD0_9BILA|nr:unnamed protein product [Rotaria socialis]CAF4356159.1 unnamed protein product [Rotaria socialis]